MESNLPVYWAEVIDGNVIAYGIFICKVIEGAVAYTIYDINHKPTAIVRMKTKPRLVVNNAEPE